MLVTMFKICVLICIVWFLFVMYLTTIFLKYLIDCIKNKFEK